MSALIDAALSHSRTVLTSLLLILIAGTYAYVNIPKEADPDINIPIVYVSLNQNGISADDSERLLIKPMEQEMSSIEGVKEMRSTAYLGGGTVLLEFDAGFDVDIALADVREKVDLAKAELPDDADEPTVHEVNLSLFPVLVVTLAGNVPERTLLRVARDLQDKIEAIPNVLEAEIGGDRDELIELIVDPLALESYNLDAPAVLESVERSNRVVAAGEMDTGRGRFAVKVPGLFETTDDILDMPVKVNGDAVVRFRDIGFLRATFIDPSGFVRVNGRPGLALEISKRTGTNIIETIESVKALIAEEAKSWPAGVEVGFSQDKSTQIRTMLDDLQNNVLSAVLLVMIVIVAALGLRSAGLVGIAIPGAFLTGILVLASIGLTVNIVVLFSLILAVGMLVDGAIVVTEYADRKMTEGLPRRDAYGLAAKRMSWPIIASTATTLAAFLPLIFWPGIVGEFMKYLPITLIAVLSASLAMALIFVPTLGSLFGRPGGTVDRGTVAAIAAHEHNDLRRMRGFTGVYVRVLGAALKRPGRVVLAAVALLIGVQWYYAENGRGVEFFPEVEPESVQLWVHGRGNLSIDERDTLLRQVEEQVLALQVEREEFHSIYARSLASAGRQNDEEPEDLIGTIQLEFVDWFARRSADEILDEIRAQTAHLAGITVETRKQESGPPVGKPIQIQVGANDPARIGPVVEQILEGLREIGDLVDIEEGTPIPGIEWELTIDRAQAAKFGADVSLIGSYVQMVTKGLEIGEFRPDHTDEEVDIVVRLPEAFRTTQQLGRIRVQTSVGLVPISNFVELSAKPKTSLLRRVDGKRVMTIKAEVSPGVLPDDKTRQIKTWLASIDLDPAVSVSFKGEDEEQKAAQAFLLRAFAIALFMMAIILVTQFNSFYSAFLILSAVVMSTIGVMIGLLVTDQPFGIVMSGIGVIALAGIVVNNNIVLIDTFDRLKQDSDNTLEAILRTGAQRLRPVLLTTVTTVLGLMPMVLRANIDFIERTVQVGGPSTQWWVQLATAIVFGLSFATLLTLVVTPCALMLRGNLHDWRLHRRAAKSEAISAQQPEPAPAE
jgi:multidrug efflux pump